MSAAGIERFLGELQCPVCLLIPREGPVGACSVGHIVCKGCQVNVESCPTCRRQLLRDGTNTIVNNMIEVIPHSCKYSKFGCKIKKRVIELKEHESKCPQRTNVRTSSALRRFKSGSTMTMPLSASVTQTSIYTSVKKEIPHSVLEMGRASKVECLEEVVGLCRVWKVLKALELSSTITNIILVRNKLLLFTSHVQ